jgi:geranylgeranyl diphosphate synthase, type II
MNFTKHLSAVESALSTYSIPTAVPSLTDPIFYLLGIGGKRIRPVLTLMSHELFGGQAENVLSQALAIEVFHNFTLMHDDIMDVAPLRRGQATVHEKWDTNVAILSGDGMMIQSYELLAKNQEAKFLPLFRTFNKTAWEVCEGQAMDMQFEKRLDVTTEEYLEMIRLKTAVLLGCALELGAIAANASSEDCEHIRLFGEHVGLSFQLRDDYLDAFGDPEKFGKQVGGDILSDKKTFLYLHATKNALEADKQLLQALHGQTSAEKVEQVKGIFQRCGADQLILEQSEAYYNSALEHLESLHTDEQHKAPLKELAMWLLERQS